MNDLGNKYALAALKEKRARLAGEITELKKQITWKQEQLGHVDATLLLFDPSANPEALPKVKPYKHVALFRQGELSRLIVDTLRRAGKPLTRVEITEAVTAYLGQPQDKATVMGPRVRSNLHYQEGKGSVVKTGEGANAKWALSA